MVDMAADWTKFLFSTIDTIALIIVIINKLQSPKPKASNGYGR